MLKIGQISIGVIKPGVDEKITNELKGEINEQAVFC